MNSSIATIAPSPRTSPIVGCLSASERKPVINRSPTARLRASRFSSSKISSTASAAAQATGLPAYVLPRPPGPGASMISARPMIADSGTPPPSDLAIVITSGATPHCSHASQVPVRPAPVCTSSAISTMPCWSHSARSRCANSGDAM